jgi:hypothetical protein
MAVVLFSDFFKVISTAIRHATNFATHLRNLATHFLNLATHLPNLGTHLPSPHSLLPCITLITCEERPPHPPIPSPNTVKKG